LPFCRIAGSIQIDGLYLESLNSGDVTSYLSIAAFPLSEHFGDDVKPDMYATENS